MKFKVGQMVKTTTGHKGIIVFVDYEDPHHYTPYLLSMGKYPDSHRSETIWYLLDCDEESEERIEEYRNRLPKGFTLDDKIYSRWIGDNETELDRFKNLDLL